MLVRDILHHLGWSAASQNMKIPNQMHLVVIANFVSDLEPAGVAGAVLPDSALEARDPSQSSRRHSSPSERPSFKLALADPDHPCRVTYIA